MGILFNGTETAEEMLIKLSGLIVTVVSLVCVLSISLLFGVGIGAGSNPTEVYIRIISSVVSLFILGAFFASYFNYHASMNGSLRRLKIVSSCLAAAGFIKVAISVYFFMICLSGRNLVGLFYVGEILVWTFVAIFAILYHNRLKNNTKKDMK